MVATNHLLVFPETENTASPAGLDGPGRWVNIPLGNTGWVKLISVFYTLQVEGSAGSFEDSLFEMKVVDASENTVYRQRIDRGVAASRRYARQTIGDPGDENENGFIHITPNRLPTMLLIPPGSTIRVIVSSGNERGGAIGAVIVTQDA